MPVCTLKTAFTVLVDFVNVHVGEMATGIAAEDLLDDAPVPAPFVAVTVKV